MIGLSGDREMMLNPCKEKHLTNVRSTEKEEAVILNPPKVFSIEEAIGFVEADELVEVSPYGVRMRKTELNADMRKKLKKE